VRSALYTLSPSHFAPTAPLPPPEQPRARRSFLFEDDKDAALAAFLATRPTLPDYEAKLAWFAAVDDDIDCITPYHSIGCIVLRTQPLRHSLKAETAFWKAHYATVMLARARAVLSDLTDYLARSRALLSRDVTTVDEIGDTLAALKVPCRPLSASLPPPSMPRATDGAPRSRPSPRTHRTRRVPRPLLIGHAASLAPYSSDTPCLCRTQAPMRRRRRPPPPSPLPLVLTGHVSSLLPY
jgi:hypothetical protein